jgi:hypothetical protein
MYFLSQQATDLLGTLCSYKTLTSIQNTSMKTKGSKVPFLPQLIRTNKPNSIEEYIQKKRTLISPFLV